MRTTLLIIQMLSGSVLLIAGLVKLILLLLDYSMANIPPARGLFPATPDTRNDKKHRILSIVAGLIYLAAGAGLLLMATFAGYESSLLSAL